MKRRKFLGVVGAAAAWPLVAHAQPPAMPVIGFLSSRSPGESATVVAAFRQGLHEAGLVEGQNLVIAFRWADGRYDQLPALAAELVGLRVSLLFAAGGPPSALAAKAATSTIPVVFSGASDPVGIGLVASLNKPGGNVTGMSVFSASLAGKRLELAKELVPSAGVFGYLLNPGNPSVSIELEGARNAASALGIELHILNASTEQDLDAAFAEAVKRRTGVIVVAGEPFFDSRRDRLVALAARARHRCGVRLARVRRGCGLISYGTSLPDSYRQAGIYVGRILKGEKPASLPVQQPTKFELAINLKTAKSLGLIIRPALITRADEVIE